MATTGGVELIGVDEVRDVASAFPWFDMMIVTYGETDDPDAPDDPAQAIGFRTEWLIPARAFVTEADNLVGRFVDATNRELGVRWPGIAITRLRCELVELVDPPADRA